MEDGARPGAPSPLRRQRLGLSGFRPLGSGGSNAECSSGVPHIDVIFRGAPRVIRGAFWSARSCCSRRRWTGSSATTRHSSRRFRRRGDCARARPGDVVRLWSGLGYNRRALNLHRAASGHQGDHGASFPEDERALRALAGVGPYTARAVQSFAFELDVAPVDTNVVRILARCIAGTGVTPGQAQMLADRLLPARRSWEFNQAMFDIGATVCTASRPTCEVCPLRLQCRWRRRGLSDPDPWRASPSVRPQSQFAGSDRQGRGRLVHALRRGGVTREMLPAACGWSGDRRGPKGSPTPSSPRVSPNGRAKSRRSCSCAEPSLSPGAFARRPHALPGARVSSET